MDAYELKKALLAPYRFVMQLVEFRRPEVEKALLNQFDHSPSTYKLIKDIRKYRETHNPEWDFRDALFEFLTDTDLKEGQLVFDLGYFHGEWSQNMLRKSMVKSYAFEPHPRAFRNEKKKLVDAGIEDIKLFKFGLSNKNYQATLTMHGEGSNIFKPDPLKKHTDKTLKEVSIELKNIDDFLAQENIDCVEFIKINIEGGEYELLEHLIETDQLTKFKQIQVQFHEWMPNARKRRKKIREAFSRHYECEWCYNFIWERWKLKSS
jgi:FkbM family methyltransferase